VKAVINVSQDPKDESEDVSGDLVANPDKFDGEKRSGTTYQLLIYSFCDSNSDGIGDFNGITSKLDYFDSLGVTALWLSPLHPAMSYHGYDVTDYYSVNSEYGTEADFQNLIDQAHNHNIKIYMDYVLNHSGSDHPWFTSAAASEDSEYRDYYIFSYDPESDIKAGKIPMIETSGYDAGQWFTCGGGGEGRYKFVLNTSSSNPTIIVTKTTENTYTGSSSVKWNLWYGDVNDSNFPYFRKDGDNTYSMVIDFASSWGFLVRSDANWNTGSKYGAKSSSDNITFGTPFTLYPSTSSFDPANISITATCYFHSHFYTDWFADFNYGSAATAETSPAFKDLAASADKWLKMGVDGLRLDAVKHIYHNASSDENPTFLQKWYDRCNETYKAQGNTEDIFMVGEVLNSYSDGASYAKYLKGLPSVFDFSFWWTVKDALNNQNGSTLPGLLMTYQAVYDKADGINSTKLSNHDEDRAMNELGKSTAKAKQAAAILLTASGKPFIYQGEELGYTGTNTNSQDEWRRAPMNWDGGSLADAKLNGRYDAALKGSSYSVKTQEADANSILNVYKQFSRLRNTYPALAEGTMSVYGDPDNAVAAWYMTDSEGNKMLVVHNLSSSKKTFETSADMSKPVGLLGGGSINGKYLTLNGNSSVVFKLY